MLRRARPSSLQIAQFCTAAPWLGVHHPESTRQTEAGDSVDAYVSMALMSGTPPPADQPEAIALLDWVRSNFPKDAEFFPAKKVTLIDPRTGEVLSQGTTDLLVRFKVGERVRAVVVDWKSIGQMYAGYLPAPDDALQQLTYMVAGGLELRADEGQVILACFDDKRVKPLIGKVFSDEEWWPILDRIAAIPQFDPEGPRPTATKGDHCKTCWQRPHCAAYLLPAIEGAVPVALQPFVEGGGGLSTAAEALAGLDWVERAKESISIAEKAVKAVEAQLETYTNLNGPVRRGDEVWGPVPTAGKRSAPKVGELEKTEFKHLIRPPVPGVKYDWRTSPLVLSDKGGR